MRFPAFVAMCCIAVLGCAKGNSSGGGPVDAPAAQRDGRFVTGDAPPSKFDARLPDAFVPQDAPAPDAPSGPFCSSNSQCTTAGQCCVTLGGPSGFCAPGTVVLGQCVPQ